MGCCSATSFNVLEVTTIRINPYYSDIKIHVNIRYHKQYQSISILKQASKQTNPGHCFTCRYLDCMFALSYAEWFMCRVGHSLCSHPSAEGRQFPCSHLKSDFNAFEQHFATSQLEANCAPVCELHKCDMETWNLQQTEWHITLKNCACIDSTLLMKEGEWM